MVDVLGSLAHSELTPNERVVLALPRSAVQDLANLVALDDCPPPVRSLLQLLRSRLAKAFRHVLPLDRDEFLDDERNLSVVVDAGDLSVAGGFDFSLAYLAHALEEVADAEGAEASILILATGGADWVQVQLPGSRGWRFRRAPDPTWLPQEGRVASEDDPTWKQAPVHRRDHLRSLQQLIHRGLAAKLKTGKGDHTRFEVTFSAAPWATAFTADAAAFAKGPRRVLLTVDMGRDEFPAGFANEPAREFGLSPRRTWWLLFGGQEGDCSRKLLHSLRAG